MRGELIRILSSVEEKANELKLEGYEPDILFLGKEAYDYVKVQVQDEFGGDEDVTELSGIKVKVVEEFGGDGVVVDTKNLGLGLGGAKRFRVVQ